MGHGPRPTSVVTTHSVVALPEKYSGRTPGLVPD
jgi:hypothetical protein